MIIFVTFFRAASASRIFFLPLPCRPHLSNHRRSGFLPFRSAHARCRDAASGLRRGCLRPARARCRGRPGMRFKNSSAHAARHASQISSSDASTLPHSGFHARFRRTARFFLQNDIDCIAESGQDRTRAHPFPPTRTVPRLVSYRRGMSCTSVVFEEPVPPRIPTV